MTDMTSKVDVDLVLHTDMTMSITFKHVPLNDIEDLFEQVGGGQFTATILEHMADQVELRQASEKKDELFEPVPSTRWNRPSGKVQCRVCGREGYDNNRWQDGCKRGHLPCPDCGKQLTVLTDGSARHHIRCPAKKGGHDGVIPFRNGEG